MMNELGKRASVEATAYIIYCNVSDQVFFHYFAFKNIIYHI